MVDYIAMAARKARETEKAEQATVQRRNRKRPARKDKAGDRPRRGILRRLFVWGFRACLLFGLVCIGWVALYSVLNPPTTYLMVSEWRRLGAIEHQWVSMEDITPDMALSAAAAEDARFCQHQGFDFEAIQEALADKTRTRGASTISQQVAKNAFLWPGRNWVRKGLEAGFTVLIEQMWSKRRIMEVYLNIAEFDEGVFGVQAAAQRYFGVDARSLTLREASRIAGVLPSPKSRNAASPTSYQRRHARRIAAGADTLRVEGGACLRT